MHASVLLSPSSFDPLALPAEPALPTPPLAPLAPLPEPPALEPATPLSPAAVLAVPACESFVVLGEPPQPPLLNDNPPNNAHTKLLMLEAFQACPQTSMQISSSRAARNAKTPH